MTVEQLHGLLHTLLGLGVDPADLTLQQVVLRAIVVFFAALLMIRTGDKRFFARRAAFDYILAFMLGAILARAVNGSAPLFESIGAGFVLLWLHRLLGIIARHWHPFGVLIKGRPEKVIEDGEILHEALRRNNLTERDLREDLRLNAAVDDPAEVKSAWLERDGNLSVFKKKS